MRRVVLATRNDGKVREIQELLAGLPLELIGLSSFPDAPEVAETGRTFAENACIKARAIADFTGEMTIADDSGLEVDYLGGEPGVYSARYGQPEWNDADRYRYLLQRLAAAPDGKRSARFRSVVALVDPFNSVFELTDGTVEGVIARDPRGNNGFGYDPVFYLPEYGRTMAELAEAEKNQLSHRSQAVKKIIPRLTDLLNKRRV